MGDVAGPGYSEGDNARSNTRMMDNADRPDRIKGKIDITLPDKTNKILILVSY